MKQILIYTALFLAAVLSLYMMDKVSSLEDEKNRLSVQLAHAHITLQRDTIRDSIEVVTQTVVEVVPKKMKEALAADRQLIKELLLRIGQLEALQTTTIETADTVAAVRTFRRPLPAEEGAGGFFSANACGIGEKCKRVT